MSSLKYCPHCASPTVDIRDDRVVCLKCRSTSTNIGTWNNRTENEKKREKCYDICCRLYIARNITLSQGDIVKELENIDKLLKNQENYN